MSEPLDLEANSDATVNVEVQNLTLAHNHLELQVVQEGQREFRFPFFEDEIDLEVVAEAAFSQDVPWIARLSEGHVVLEHKLTGDQHHLDVGESHVVENRRIWLVDVRQAPLATLEGISQEITGRFWHLKNHQTWLGRRGKRLNHIELDHPTVSRTHATFSPHLSGRVNLLSESGASPTTVNGEPLAAGTSRTLANGDLLAFGKVLFRFSGQTEEGAMDEANLFVRTLSPFRISTARDTGQEVVIKNEKARWLFSLLASRWGEVYPVERLIEQFWPNVQATRGRKNLSYTLLQLKQAFKTVNIPLESILTRTPSELRLKPERLGHHDFVEVSQLCAKRKAITSKSALERLASLYQECFLQNSYESWATELRSNLEQNLLATLRETIRYFEERQDHEAISLAAQSIKKLEPLNDEVAIALMKSAITRAKPEEAIIIFEEFEKELKKEGFEPPIEAVKQYHRAKIGI